MEIQDEALPARAARAFIQIVSCAIKQIVSLGGHACRVLLLTFSVGWRESFLRRCQLHRRE
eukprot:11190948-Lingulodinium_polyedra.AAC.1